jgi:hypothetical protein
MRARRATHPRGATQAGRPSNGEARQVRPRVFVVLHDVDGFAVPEEPQREIPREALQEDSDPSAPEGEGVAAGSR